MELLSGDDLRGVQAQTWAEHVKKLDPLISYLNFETVEAISGLWSLSLIRELADRRSEFQVSFDPLDYNGSRGIY